MSVIVKGMEMPKNCKSCPLRYSSTGYAWCDITGASLALEIDMRDYTCPLVEIPTPHGRLGDLDKLKADYSMKNDCAECEKELQGSSRACEYDRIYSKMDFCQWIDNAETVIEAGGRA